MYRNRIRQFLVYSMVTLGCMVAFGSLACGNKGDEKPDSSSGPDPLPEIDNSALSGKWSSTDTWSSGKVPVDGETVSIPEGVTVILDEDTADLGVLIIDGNLVFEDEGDRNLTAASIMLHGALEVGTEEAPFQHVATITLTDSDVGADYMGMGTRGIAVMGGTLDLHGIVPTPTWTQLGKTAPAGATDIELTEEVDWAPGSRLVVAPTDFFAVGRTEVTEVASTDGKSVTLTSALEREHWGELQYVDSEGVTLTPTTTITDKVIDERGEVGTITRNVIVQGIDDDTWKSEGFGAHIMVMVDSVARISGVEVRRGGQAGILSRYPIHFHLMSYDSDGQALEDAVESYVHGSAIWDSAQRCIVVHGTNGLSVIDNICYDIDGHAYFLEDGVERRNVFDHNLALGINRPPDETVLREHEKNGFRRGPSGFWLTHPDNVLRNNAVADSEGIGYWMAFADFPLGPSANVDEIPSAATFGEFDNCVAHSNNGLGLNLDFAPLDDEGNTAELSYRPTTTEKKDGTPAPYSLTGYRAYKHDGNDSSGSFWNRTGDATFRDFVISSFGGFAFKGASTCVITENLVVGTTLNDANLAENVPVGMATYHSTCDITNCVLVNLPVVAGEISGAFATEDYYIRPVDKGLIRNVDNVLIQTDPGWRTMSPNLDGSDNWALAGALWDPYGLWGPAGNYWVYDVPFLTSGTTCVPVPPEGNGMSCVGPYIGLGAPLVDDWDDRYIITYPLTYTRTDTDGGTTWNIDDGLEASKLGHMRHAAVPTGSVVTVDYPTMEGYRVVQVVRGMLTADDTVMIGLQYSGSTPQTVYVTSISSYDEIPGYDSYQAWKDGDPNWQDGLRGQQFYPLTGVGSTDEVLNGDGTVFFHDEANERVWVKAVGDLVEQADPSDDPFSDTALYESVRVVVDEEEL